MGVALLERLPVLASPAFKPPAALPNSDPYPSTPVRESAPPRRWPAKLCPAPAILSYNVVARRNGHCSRALVRSAKRSRILPTGPSLRAGGVSVQRSALRGRQAGRAGRGAGLLGLSAAPIPHRLTQGIADGGVEQTL